MHVLITGGYGCIGSWIAKNLLERGHRVWIYDLNEDPRRLRLILDEAKVKQVGFIQGDVTDLAGLRQALKLFGISHVLHLAGLQVPT
ncbi:MAG TPA: NAD(P)-dependent oxidoreductase, partial [Gemmataceae bacterium]|nr:NAD(P)-dependent oxidoreductase [Gemmataceae bacterium]